MSAFANCAVLKNVTIGKSVEVIGVGAFGACPALESIVIPDSVKKIGNNAFGGCGSLSSITIGASVVSIGSNSVCNCTKLKSAVFRKTDGWKSTGAIAAYEYEGAFLSPISAAELLKRGFGWYRGDTRALAAELRSKGLDKV